MKAARRRDRAAPKPPYGRRMTGVFEDSITARRAAQIISLATAVLVALAGVLMRFADHQTFPNVWLGMWWAVQTVTSVGYGDIVPHTVTGRLLAVFVMINGIAFLTVVIATISAAFVESARRRGEASPSDSVLSELQRISSRLEQIEQRLDGAVRSDEPAPKPR